MKPVEFTTRGLKDLKKVKSFNKKFYGSSEKAQEVIDKIITQLELLESIEIDFSTIGSIDDQFSHLTHEYRKFIIDHCKITYRIGKTKIYVIRVFDTRQRPSKNL